MSHGGKRHGVIMQNEMHWVRWQRDGFDVLNCLNGNTHRLTLLDLRSDTGNPNSIGFIRALLSAGYGERRPWDGARTPLSRAG